MDQHATNYFVCTLDQAAGLGAKRPDSYGTINDFFDDQCKQSPHASAAGFPAPSKDGVKWTYQVFSKWTPGKPRGHYRRFKVEGSVSHDLRYA